MELIFRPTWTFVFFSVSVITIILGYVDNIANRTQREQNSEVPIGLLQKFRVPKVGTSSKPDYVRYQDILIESAQALWLQKWKLRNLTNVYQVMNLQMGLNIARLEKITDTMKLLIEFDLHHTGQKLFFDPQTLKSIELTNPLNKSTVIKLLRNWTYIRRIIRSEERKSDGDAKLRKLHEIVEDALKELKGSLKHVAKEMKTINATNITRGT